VFGDKGEGGGKGRDDFFFLKGGRREKKGKPKPFGGGEERGIFRIINHRPRPSKLLEEEG